MSKGDKQADPARQKGQAAEEGTAEGPAQKVAARPQSAARAWAAVNKLPGGGKQVHARRKVPSGPLGGSGRKTNVSRSS